VHETSRGQARSRYEEQLARAHRSLYWAAERAADLHDEGAEEDVLAIMAVLSTLMNDSLATKPRPRRQQEIPTSNLT